MTDLLPILKDRSRWAQDLEICGLSLKKIINYLFDSLIGPMLIRCLTKMEKIKMTIEKITPPKGWPKDKPWTEKEAAEAMAAADSGLSRDDFSDDGADLQELKEIIEGGN